MDPGAVPGTSTKKSEFVSPIFKGSSFGGEIGSTHVVKVLSFARYSTTVIGLFKINANSNVANGNSVGATGGFAAFAPANGNFAAVAA